MGNVARPCGTNMTKPQQQLRCQQFIQSQNHWEEFALKYAIEFFSGKSNDPKHYVHLRVHHSPMCYLDRNGLCSFSSPHPVKTWDPNMRPDIPYTSPCPTQNHSDSWNVMVNVWLSLVGNNCWISGYRLSPVVCQLFTCDCFWRLIVKLNLHCCFHWTLTTFLLSNETK